MHLAGFVVGIGIFLEALGYGAVVDNHGLSVWCALLEKLEDIEEFAGVASAEPEKCGGLLHTHIALRKHGVVLQRPVQQLLQFRGLKGLEGIDLRPR